MTKTMTKSISYNQDQLKLICDDLCDNIELLFDYLKVEDYRLNNRMYMMKCPIHGGDNTSALNIYHLGDTYRGNWTCRTHGCEKTFKGSIIGFIRGIISVEKYLWSKSGDKICPFEEAIRLSLDFLQKDIKNFKVSSSDIEKKIFSQTIDKIKKQEVEKCSNITRETTKNILDIPSTYYVSRGYSEEILIKYDIGLCSRPGKEMSNRVVAPVYCDNHKYVVGCTGRSPYNKCPTCLSFHEETKDCPPKDSLHLHSKWKHNTGFKTQNHLYNYWFAKEHIFEDKIAIIVESPGNVWKLEENGIHNSVALFGCSLSDRQKIILDGSGAMSLIILMDNDEAGKKATDQIQNKCKSTYRIFIPTISKQDIGDMTPEEISQDIKEFIERIK